jgi:hypothetical protein
MLPLPKNRPCLVEDGGGGGLCSCDAVGARDWRMEYVLCMVMARIYNLQGEFASVLVGWKGNRFVAECCI